jgi:hypothetical protein
MARCTVQYTVYRLQCYAVQPAEGTVFTDRRLSIRFLKRARCVCYILIAKLTITPLPSHAYDVLWNSSQNVRGHEVIFLLRPI